MISPEPEAAVFRQLASRLREKITAGEWAPGQRIPSENDLVHEFGRSRETVRKALGILRNEGLIVVRHGYPTRVRESAPTETVRVQRGSEIYARPATATEAQALGVAEGALVTVVVDPAGRERAYAPERARFTFS